MGDPACMIDDLSGAFPESSIGTRWQLLSDAVMGGVSAGGVTRTVIAQRPAIRMQGMVSLENNGGFLQIALDLARNEEGSGQLVMRTAMPDVNSVDFNPLALAEPIVLDAKGQTEFENEFGEALYQWAIDEYSKRED